MIHTRPCFLCGQAPTHCRLRFISAPQLIKTASWVKLKVFQLNDFSPEMTPDYMRWYRVSLPMDTSHDSLLSLSLFPALSPLPG